MESRKNNKEVGPVGYGLIKPLTNSIGELKIMLYKDV
jgi:hypothetical protein